MNVENYIPPEFVENSKKVLEATSFGSVTLVGVFAKDYPIPRGNCFGLIVNNREYNILNFVYENLDHLIETNVITLPIKILPLTENHALIYDERIPYEYYKDKLCSICTPRHLIPITQLMFEHFDILNGKLEMTKTDSFIVSKRKIAGPPKTLGFRYSEEEPEIAYGALTEIVDPLDLNIDPKFVKKIKLKDLDNDK